MGIAVMMLIRTRFSEEKMQAAMAGGAAQLVVLGAGFDARAYRVPELVAGKKVFEVDSAATQEWKRKRIQAALGGAPANLTYVTIDFNRDSLGAVLRAAGFSQEQKAFFTWEGVSMY